MERHTEETESGSPQNWQAPMVNPAVLLAKVKGRFKPRPHWHTPRANDAEKRGNLADKAQSGLPAQVQNEWPTPRASENENRTTKNAPSHGKSHGRTLAGTVHEETARPSPAARDWKDSGTEQSQWNRHSPGLSVMVVINGQQDLGGQHGWEEPRLAYTEKQSPRSARQPREGADTRTVESEVGVATPRLPFGVARWRRESLKAIGNSVVPQVVYEVFKAIEHCERGSGAPGLNSRCNLLI